jgi:hypothetical protein
LVREGGEGELAKGISEEATIGEEVYRKTTNETKTEVTDK